ncbi:sodium-dependent bicarbonate transport family permease [Rhodospirillum centenum]|uniref:Membrane protein, putative n=1 Tax=Rhodospirillum centenum (strain ATCC 51521 / SW) TaxID=414684 RepID=B6ISZ3_RHOCS|nr:sodium-dependent bicarbonate transport family permease [Rhodospirillum centenum]ACI98664.1 membrane protein, putative [Rhodospirillum centenum SW]
MSDLIQLGLTNLISPMVLSFALGFAAAVARSDLDIPEAVGRALAIYLMFAIGFKGGAALAANGAGGGVVAAMLAALLLSAALPFLAYALLRALTRIGPVDAGAVAAHYGSISIVTFVTGSQFVTGQGIGYEGYLVAMMALMETPAIVSGLFLARRALARQGGTVPGAARKDAFLSQELLREILLNASVVVLVGGFLIGWATGERGMLMVKPFVADIFNGVLCLFLLDMGLVAARQLRSVKALSAPLLAFGLYMPLLGAAAGLGTAWLLGLSLGGATLLAVLTASASYIAVPAAMRLALPQANPAVYVTLSLVITFPFNVVVGIPLYFAAARALGFV